MPSALTWSVTLPSPSGGGTTFLPSTAIVGPASSDRLGVDVVCFPDLDPAFTLEGGTHCLASALIRRLETPPGGLFYDQDYGTDIRDLVNSGNVDNFSTLASLVTAECKKDDRVADVDVTSTFTAATSTLAVRIVVTTSTAQTFALVLSVSDVTLDALKVS